MMAACKKAKEKPGFLPAGSLVVLDFCVFDTC